MRPRTRPVHAGADRPSPGVPGRPSAPLEQASAALFDNLEDLEEAYAAGGMLYRPYGAGNAERLERAVAELEGAEMEGEVAAVATSSGCPRSTSPPWPASSR